MIQVPFMQYENFVDCPVWWQNFSTAALLELKKESTYSSGQRDKCLNSLIEKHNGTIIDSENSDLINFLEFETEDDFTAFKIHWTLYGI